MNTHLVRRLESLMRERYLMERIMETETGAGHRPTTTSFQQPRGIGPAAHHACRGKPEIDYPTAEETPRVHWRRA